MLGVGGRKEEVGRGQRLERERQAASHKPQAVVRPLSSGICTQTRDNFEQAKIILAALCISLRSKSLSALEERGLLSLLGSFALVTPEGEEGIKGLWK